MERLQQGEYKLRDLVGRAGISLDDFDSMADLVLGDMDIVFESLEDTVDIDSSGEGPSVFTVRYRGELVKEFLVVE